MGSGEWRVESGERGVGNGEWGVESGGAGNEHQRLCRGLGPRAHSESAPGLGLALHRLDFGVQVLVFFGGGVRVWTMGLRVEG